MRIIEKLNSSSLWSLVTANLLVAALALRFNWSLVELLWIYWCQSVIIGAINFFKILSLGFTVSGRRLPANQATKLFPALFFAAHYGIFHLVYLIFLAVFSLDGVDLPLGGGVINLSGIIFSALIFLSNHLFSFFTNWPREKMNANIVHQMSIPYWRIIPMHLTIILGVALSAATGGAFAPLLLFLSLKTFSDVALHLYEHRNISPAVLTKPKAT